MASPGFGLCWFLWRRARWGFAAIAGYFVLAFVLMTFFSGQKRDDDAVMLMLPTLAAFIFVFTIFGYGDTDFGARESGFPRNALTLPVESWRLVFWPMLFGGIVVATLWVLLATVILRPGGLPAPVVWPATMLAALLASMQAAVIWPYGVRYARLPVVLGAGVLIINLVVVATHYKTPASVRTVVSLGMLLLAYWAAVAGLRRARRGDGTEWRWLRRVVGLFERGLRRRPPLGSPLDAQRWMERTRNALLIPGQAFMICLPMTVLALITRGKRDTGHLLVGEQLVEINPFALVAGIMLCLPVLLAMFTGSLLGKRDIWSKDLTVGSFLGVRPISCVDLIGAKLQTAWWVSMLTWGIVLVSVAGWALLMPQWSGPVLAKAFGAPVSTGRAVSATLVLTLLVALTWKLQAVSLWLSLYGRKWVTTGFPMLMLAFWMIASPLAHWVYRSPARREAVRLWFDEWLAWLVLGMLVLKVAASVGVVRELLRRDLVDRSRVTSWVELWLAVSGLLCLPFWWLLPVQGAKIVPMILGCMLLVPFTRLAAAPLMLHFNRHR